LAEFFKSWHESGNRLDLVLNLHNVESAEGSHVFCPAIEPERRLVAEQFHSQLMHRLENDQFIVTAKPLDVRTTWFRLSGYLGLMYGPLPMAYEVNSQQRARHLSLEELRSIGASMVRTAAEFTDSGTTGLVASIRDLGRRRDTRAASFKKERTQEALLPALDLEWAAWEWSIESLRRSD
jgi:hypothetical protein